jgi:hypothetical protein
MSILLRPLSTSELLDRTFFLYRNNFVLFAGIAALAELPVVGMRLADTFLVETRVPAWRPVAVSVLLAANFLAVAVSHAATVIAVSDLHLDRPASIRPAYAGARSSFLRVIWISFVVTVVVPLLIAIPVIIVAVIVVLATGMGDVGGIPIGSIILLVGVFAISFNWWLARALVVPVTVLERRGLRDSMDRSRALTEKARGRIFVICALALVLSWAVTAVMQLPAAAGGGLHFVRGRMTANTRSSAIMAIGAFAGASLTGPLLTIALTLAYYDARVRKEALDLELMLQNLAAVPEQDSTAKLHELLRNSS